jgi:hypothetical protein
VTKRRSRLSKSAEEISTELNAALAAAPPEAREMAEDQLVEHIENLLRGTKWKSKDGRTIPVAEMTDSHLANTINMLFRGKDIQGQKVPERLKEKLPVLTEEWVRRFGDASLPPGPVSSKWEPPPRKDGVK